MWALHSEHETCYITASKECPKTSTIHLIHESIEHTSSSSYKITSAIFVRDEFFFHVQILTECIILSVLNMGLVFFSFLYLLFVLPVQSYRFFLTHFLCIHFAMHLQKKSHFSRMKPSIASTIHIHKQHFIYNVYKYF